MVILFNDFLNKPLKLQLFPVKVQLARTYVALSGDGESEKDCNRVGSNERFQAPCLTESQPILWLLCVLALLLLV